MIAQFTLQFNLQYKSDYLERKKKLCQYLRCSFLSLINHYFCFFLRAHAYYFVKKKTQRYIQMYIVKCMRFEVYQLDGKNSTAADRPCHVDLYSLDRAFQSCFRTFSHANSDANLFPSRTTFTYTV